jgi:hypothetical protein
MRARAFLPVVAPLLVAALPAAAHHGWGSYDANKVLVFQAKIVESS